MRKMRKQPNGPLYMRDFSAEAGDRAYEHIPGWSAKYVYIYDIRESTGRNKRDAGILTPHLVKKNGKPRIAYHGDKGFWYWLPEERKTI